VTFVSFFSKQKAIFCMNIRLFVIATRSLEFLRYHGLPGSTNDVIACGQSILYKVYKEGKILERVHFVLDEAYSSIGGNQCLIFEK